MHNGSLARGPATKRLEEERGGEGTAVVRQQREFRGAKGSNISAFCSTDSGPGVSEREVGTKKNIDL